MPDLLLFPLIGLALLAVIGLVLRWAVKEGKRAHDQHLMGRVYFPTRGRKADLPRLKRRNR